MPATVIYRFGYPTTAKAVETSASVAPDGLVSGSAVFVVNAESAAFPVNKPIDQSYFSSLKGLLLQGLFVESRSLEKRGGLVFLRLGVVGAINPPVFEVKRDVSPRSISRSQQRSDGNTDTFSFDYHGETYSVSTILVQGSRINIPVPTPRALGIWNRIGRGSIARTQETGQFDTQDNPNASIVVRPRILTTETREERAGIVRIVRSAQFVYE